MREQTVVITGASGGIGRAAARLFGERGARVVLIARGQAGLEGAAADVAKAGGKALVIAADVADYAQVAAAARQAEEHFGPIDVWVNDAFTSVFAPFSEITAAEFRRVTEVSYLGFVHGTMAALERMRARDHGTIVQVGSALGQRSIPLQSAYCGAKHAVNGFTSVAALRADAPGLRGPRHRGADARGQHPAVLLGPVPAAAPPPAGAADLPARGGRPRRAVRRRPPRPQAVLGRCQHDRHLAGREVRLPAAGPVPGPDRVRRPADQPGRRAGPPGNLWEPADGAGGQDYGPHGVFDDRSHPRSAQQWLSQHARLTTAAALASVAAAAGSLAAARRR